MQLLSGVLILFTAAAGGAPPPVVFTQSPVNATAGALSPGSRIVRLDAGAVRVLTPGFDAAGRPDVSFDGRRILFIARREPGEPLDVWEMNAGGGEPRRVTRDAGNCAAAVYLPAIYTMDAGPPIDRIALVADGGAGGPTSLYVCRRDGTGVRRITFDPAGAADPCVLRDGRLLYRGGAAGQLLLTVNTDGTDVFPFADDHERHDVRSMPCETAQGWVVYVEGRERGALAAVSTAGGRGTRRVIAAEDGGVYASPAPLTDEALLVSYRLRAGGSYGLYVLAGGRREPLYDAPQWHELDAAALRARPRPAGRSSVVNDAKRTGVLYGLDAYLSGTEDARDEGGPRIDALAVWRAEPGGRAERLGTVPVEADGSFHLTVPAATPLRVETLDARGQVIEAMRSWFWVMPGEARGCIGCHEDRQLTPPNRHVLALRREPDVLRADDGGGVTAEARRDP